MSALSHLDRLEAESVHIIREVAATFERPVLLYSIGKDSTALLQLARKAFYPAPLPFPLLHVDTTWKFRAMYDFRARVASEPDIELLIHRNPIASEQGINPFEHGSEVHTTLWKTHGLKQALDQFGFDAAFGGARRDEERSRAKERVLSFRSPSHAWDPKLQRPELWRVFNTRCAPGQSVRAFPLSNWTEIDVWQYIGRERLTVVPLYFAAPRPVINRGGTWLMMDDERMPVLAGERVVQKTVRFRTLGCYPLTGAVESTACNVAEVIDELQRSRDSERQGRLIDYDGASSMEKKKREGYF